MRFALWSRINISYLIWDIMYMHEDSRRVGWGGSTVHARAGLKGQLLRVLIDHLYFRWPPLSDLVLTPQIFWTLKNLEKVTLFTLSITFKNGIQWNSTFFYSVFVFSVPHFYKEVNLISKLFENLGFLSIFCFFFKEDDDKRKKRCLPCLSVIIYYFKISMKKFVMHLPTPLPE